MLGKEVLLWLQYKVQFLSFWVRHVRRWRRWWRGSWGSRPLRGNQPRVHNGDGRWPQWHRRGDHRAEGCHGGQCCLSDKTTMMSDNYNDDVRQHNDAI